MGVKLQNRRHTSLFFANNQLDALFHVFTYFISLHVSSITVLIIRRSNCINTSTNELPEDDQNDDRNRLERF